MAGSRRGSLTAIVLSLLAIGLALFVLNYHIVLRRGDHKLLLACPKKELGFSRTFVDTTDWGLGDLLREKDIALQVGAAYLAVLRMRMAGDTVSDEQERVVLGKLKDSGYSCAWGDHWLACLKR